MTTPPADRPPTRQVQGDPVSETTGSTETDTRAKTFVGREISSQVSDSHGIAASLSPDTRGESTVHDKVAEVVTSRPELLEKIAHDTISAIELLKQMIAEGRIKKSKTENVRLNTLLADIRNGKDPIRSYPPGVAKSFFQLCLAVELMQSECREDKDLGERFLTFACSSELFCCAQINFWLCMEALESDRPLDTSQQCLFFELLHYAIAENIPCSKWILSLIKTGLVKKFPPYDPRAGFDFFYFALASYSSSVLEHKPLNFTDDPVTFGYLDALPKTTDCFPQAFLQNLDLTWEFCLYELIPAILIAGAVLPVSKEFESQFTQRLKSHPPAIQKLFIFVKQTHEVISAIQDKVRRKKSELKKGMATAKNLGIICSEQGDDDGVLKHLERCKKLLAQHNSLNDNPEHLVDPILRKFAIYSKQAFDDFKPDHPIPPLLSALLLTQLGRLYEYRLIQSRSPMDTAVDYYRQACEQCSFPGMALFVEDYLAKTGKWDKLIDFLSKTKRLVENPESVQSKIDYYQHRKLLPPESLTDEEIDSICQKLGVLDTPESPPETKKKKKKKKKTRSTAPTAIPQEDSTKAASPEAEVLPVLMPLSEAAALPVESSEESRGWQTVPTSKKLRKLLSHQWHPDVSRYLKAALYFRDIKQDYEREKRTLEKAIDLLQAAAGVERLYEELAWHLIHSQRSPVQLVQHPEQQAEELIPKALEYLDEAQKKLEFCLARKLQCPQALVPKGQEDINERAQKIASRFSDDKAREEYRQGIHYIMSSLGHIHSERTALVSRKQQKSVRQKMQAAYAAKTL